MDVKAFYHPPTFTITYVVSNGSDAVVIDPVLDYDPHSGNTDTTSVEAVRAFLEARSLDTHFILETHAHADHLSGSQFLRRVTEAPIVICHRITEVQSGFKELLSLEESFPVDGSQFDRLVQEGDRLEAGSLDIGVLETPGHTPACVSYVIGDAVFTGDALFMPDFGTGRCDFPKGSAEALYRSIQDKLYTLPDTTRVFVGHDYQPNGRALAYETTIGESKAKNIQLTAETEAEGFVAMRQGRDSGLPAPKLLFQSVQVNIDAGRLPKEDARGHRQLRMPLNLLRSADEFGRPNK
ncbi:MAG: MBL fold metallo-hydrolase [Myxococcota bacterium]